MKVFVIFFVIINLIITVVSQYSNNDIFDNNIIWINNKKNNDISWIIFQNNGHFISSNDLFGSVFCLNNKVIYGNYFVDNTSSLIHINFDKEKVIFIIYYNIGNSIDYIIPLISLSDETSKYHFIKSQTFLSNTYFCTSNTGKYNNMNNKLLYNLIRTLDKNKIIYLNQTLSLIMCNIGNSGGTGKGGFDMYGDYKYLTNYKIYTDDNKINHMIFNNDLFKYYDYILIDPYIIEIFNKDTYKVFYNTQL
jgi:hypothetical protein